MYTLMEAIAVYYLVVYKNAFPEKVSAVVNHFTGWNSTGMGDLIRELKSHTTSNPCVTLLVLLEDNSTRVYPNYNGGTISVMGQLQQLSRVCQEYYCSRSSINVPEHYIETAYESRAIYMVLLHHIHDMAARAESLKWLVSRYIIDTHRPLNIEINIGSDKLSPSFIKRHVWNKSDVSYIFHIDGQELDGVSNPEHFYRKNGGPIITTSMSNNGKLYGSKIHLDLKDIPQVDNNNKVTLPCTVNSRHLHNGGYSI